MDSVFEGVVSGRVQGVGFRYFTRQEAIDLGVQGWVRNLPDGSVSFHLEGPEREVETMLERLRRGPLGSRVDRLQGDWMAQSEGCLHFEIRG